MKKTSSLLIAFAASALLLMAGCAGTSDQSNSTNQNASMNQTSTQSTQASGTISMAPPANSTTSFPPTAGDIAMYPQLAPPKKGDTVAIMDTDFGTIKIKLFTKQVPELTTNFINLSQSGKYVGAPFHRVVQDFMIQGGDFTNHDGTGGYSYKGPNTFLPNEIDPTLHHLYGTVSMAKTSDPVSIGSQFFIVNTPQGASFLDGSYSPIGQVYEGMDVVQKITALQIPNTESPSQMVKINKVTIQVF